MEFEKKQIGSIGQNVSKNKCNYKTSLFDLQYDDEKLNVIAANGGSLPGPIRRVHGVCDPSRSIHLLY